MSGIPDIYLLSNREQVTYGHSGADTLDALERQIRRNVLLGLMAELYQRNLSDVISVREWLETKLGEPAEDEARCEYATARNADQSETIHNQEVYKKANVVAQ